MSPTTPAMWVGSYHVLRNNGTRKLWYSRFYWQEGTKTRHVHIPGGDINHPQVRDRVSQIEALIAAGQSPEEICELVRSWSKEIKRNEYHFLSALDSSELGVSGIYRITNKRSQEIYVGASSNIARRWRDHCRNTYKKLDGLSLNKSLAACGFDPSEDNVLEFLEIDILEKTTDLRIREQWWIDQLNPTLNAIHATGYPRRMVKVNRNLRYEVQSLKGRIQVLEDRAKQAESEIRTLRQQIRQLQKELNQRR